MKNRIYKSKSFQPYRITVKRKVMSDNKIVYNAMKDFGFLLYYLQCDQELIEKTINSANKRELIENSTTLVSFIPEEKKENFENYVSFICSQEQYDFKYLISIVRFYFKFRMSSDQ